MPPKQHQFYNRSRLDSMKKLLVIIVPLLFLIGCGEENNYNKILRCVDENQDRFHNDPDNRKVEEWCEDKVE